VQHPSLVIPTCWGCDRGACHAPASAGALNRLTFDPGDRAEGLTIDDHRAVGLLHRPTEGGETDRGVRKWDHPLTVVYAGRRVPTGHGVEHGIDTVSPHGKGDRVQRRPIATPFAAPPASHSHDQQVVAQQRQGGQGALSEPIKVQDRDVGKLYDLVTVQRVRQTVSDDVVPAADDRRPREGPKFDDLNVQPAAGQVGMCEIRFGANMCAAAAQEASNHGSWQTGSRIAARVSRGSLP
jgi:hypothetical protein